MAWGRTTRFVNGFLHSEVYRRLDICHSTQSHWYVARCRKLYNPLQQQLVLSWRLLSWSCFVAAGNWLVRTMSTSCFLLALHFWWNEECLDSIIGRSSDLCSFATFCHNIPRKSWWCPEMSLVTGATMGIPEVPGEELHAVPLSRSNHPRGDAGCNGNLRPKKETFWDLQTLWASQDSKTTMRLPLFHGNHGMCRLKEKRRSTWEYSETNDWLWLCIYIYRWDRLTKSLWETPNIWTKLRVQSVASVKCEAFVHSTPYHDKVLWCSLMFFIWFWTF